MDQVTHGVNKKKLFYLISNYSLTTQIIIINLFTAGLALAFLIVFNFYLISSNKSFDTQDNRIVEKINMIAEYLSVNAIKRILTFDDSCSQISKKKEGEINRELARLECNKSILVDKNYEDKLPQLDPTYTQQYIYSNFLNTSFSIKVIADNLIKYADTNDVYIGEDLVIISDIDSDSEIKIKKNTDIYQIYKEIYFNSFNFIKHHFDKKKLNKKNFQRLKNDNITVMQAIKTKLSNSYIYIDQEQNFKTIYASPIIKDNKVYGVVLIDSLIFFKDDHGASQSILLTNFFLFFISIMFFLSFLFSKSIVTPIKILSHNTNLERDKTTNNKNMIYYPDRKDEIGKLSNDIKSMSDDLKKRIKEIEEFALDVSHELKNPLTSLKSSSDLLKKNNIGQSNRDILIKNIGIDIDRMNILISDISNYSLTQVEISEEMFEEIELIAFLNDFKKSLTLNNCTLIIKNIEKNINLKINKNKFLQVLFNLIDNSLTFSKEHSQILIFIKIIEKNCIIHFADQGPGIPLNYKSKIFERFYTDRDHEKNSHSGLGLSISKKIIESFDGSIKLIKSTHLGFEGACFEIKLPLKE